MKKATDDVELIYHECKFNHAVFNIKKVKNICLSLVCFLFSRFSVCVWVDISFPSFFVCCNYSNSCKRL